MIWRGLIAAILLIASSAQAQGRRDDFVLYTTRTGDTLYTLGERFFVRPQDYVTVQRLNRVADPHRLATGRKLRIPRSVLRHEPLGAVIAAVRGPAQIISDGRSRPAVEGGTIAEGDIIATGANGFLSLRLPDNSIVSLPSQSRIAVQRLRRVLLTRAVDRLFALLTGRARAVVTPMSNEQDDFRLSTPVSVSAVRGTEFRARYDQESARGATEVLEGKVEVSASGTGERMVPAGFGAVASAQGASVPVALLAAPAMVQPGRTQNAPGLAFEIVPQEGAARFHIQLARDAGFVDVAAEGFAAGPHLELASLDDGIWFLRASAIDRDGLEGLPATYSFERRLQHLSTAATSRQSDRYREYLFRWSALGAGTNRFRFQLMKDSPETLPVVDIPGLVTDRVTITDLEPGIYYWRVLSAQSRGDDISALWSPIEKLTIGEVE